MGFLLVLYWKRWLARMNAAAAAAAAVAVCAEVSEEILSWMGKDQRIIYGICFEEELNLQILVRSETAAGASVLI